MSLALGGELEEAERVLTEALTMRRDLEHGEGPTYAVSLRNLGLIAQKKGYFSDARRFFEEGRDILLTEENGSRSSEYARTMQLLGELLADSGDEEGALAALQTALDVRLPVLGADHPDTAVTLYALATILRRVGRDSESCDALRAVLPVFERHMGADHPLTIEVRADAAKCAPERDGAAE